MRLRPSAQGLFQVQDERPDPYYLLNPQSEERVLDVCAGLRKTTHLAGDASV